MKPQDKVLTYEQAKELKWFCKNILGTKQEFYEVLDKIQEYKDKIDRLGENADRILKYCKENNITIMGEEDENDKPKAE